MDDSEDRDHLISDEVYDAIPSEQQFPEVRLPKLRHDPAELRSSFELFCGLDDPIDEMDRVEDRIAGDEIFEFLEILTGGQRPADFRHCASLSLSSW